MGAGVPLVALDESFFFEPGHLLGERRVGDLYSIPHKRELDSLPPATQATIANLIGAESDGSRSWRGWILIDALLKAGFWPNNPRRTSERGAKSQVLAPKWR